jgi:CDP-diacylglycerol--glycerol-3-phosphate 3-phosphatidyltransferase
VVKWMGPPFLATYRGIAKLMVAWHVHPNAVTIAGSAGCLFGALYYFPQADHNVYSLFVGTMIVWWCSLLDLTDGMIARMTGKSSRFGAMLDSTLDRFVDAAVFGGIAWGLIDRHRITAMGALLALAIGSIVPYARARAEGLGIEAKVGISQRVDRLVIVLVPTGLVGLGWLDIRVLAGAVFFLAATALITVIQRMAVVWKANKADPRLPVAGR